MPGRCAAPPAPAMMTSRPVRRAVLAYSNRIRRAMRGDDARLERDTEALQRVGGGLERVPIRLRAHDDADQRFHAAIVAYFVNASRSGRKQRAAGAGRVAGRLFRPARSTRSVTAATSMPGTSAASRSIAPHLPAAGDRATARCGGSAVLRQARSAFRIERRADRLGVDLAHQLADVLLLPIQAAVRGDLARSNTASRKARAAAAHPVRCPADR